MPTVSAPATDDAHPHLRQALTSSRHCECDLGECRTDFLPLLYEISRITTEAGDLGEVLQLVLRLMHTHLKVLRAAISLRDADGATAQVQACLGLSEAEAASFGAGTVEQVLASGESLIDPRRAAAPPAKGWLSFICVPIVSRRQVLGVISAERVYDNRSLLRLDIEILAILAATTAQAVELHLAGQVRKTALEDENRRLRMALKTRFKPGNIIGNSKPMQEVYALIEKVTRSKTTVLILGESGVGKELVASAIHYHSPNAKGPFIKFNCAALPESVIESELFGHERGAFTGATGLRKGRFEEANGGTVFLDEVGELSPPMQAKLLRVLQEKNFERVGGNTTIQVDIRILAATNRNLLDMVDKGTFREDLYYRLNVFPITIPPLRERGNDIVSLVQHFIVHFTTEMGIDPPRLATPALNMLMTYHWPGNVRELENVIERAVILAESQCIESAHLPPSLQSPVSSEISARGTLEARLAAAEYDMIVEALKLHRGNMTEAARHLGLTRRILGLRMNEYKLSYREFR